MFVCKSQKESRTPMFKSIKSGTAWKASKYGVFCGPYFLVFSRNAGKYGPEKTPYLDTFHTVMRFWKEDGGDGDKPLLRILNSLAPAPLTLIWVDCLAVCFAVGDG